MMQWTSNLTFSCTFLNTMINIPVHQYWAYYSFFSSTASKPLSLAFLCPSLVVHYTGLLSRWAEQWTWVFCKTFLTRRTWTLGWFPGNRDLATEPSMYLTSSSTLSALPSRLQTGDAVADLLRNNVHSVIDWGGEKCRSIDRIHLFEYSRSASDHSGDIVCISLSFSLSVSLSLSLSLSLSFSLKVYSFRRA